MIVKNKKNTGIVTEFIKLKEQIKYEIDTSIDKKEALSNAYRLKQTDNIIKIISEYPKEIKDGEDLKNIKGIGSHTIDRINEILKNGSLKEIKTNKKKEEFLAQVEDLEKIIGVGRKKAIEFIKKYNIKSVKELKDAYEQKKIELNDKVLLGLKYYGKVHDNIPRSEMDNIDKYIQKQLTSINKELFGVLCGSYRREKATSGDIDILITHPNIKTLSELKNNKNNYLIKLVEKLRKDKFLIDDMTDKNFINKYMGFCRLNKNSKIRRIDIRYMPYKSYYSALLYFTGSKDFNKKMRNVAINLGYKLNEYGLYRKKNGKLYRTIVESEKDIFDKLGMEYVEPKNR